ncbi:NPP1 family protein [Endozoicomonas sp. SM1973]|uniref:NPP1 family protein n=1 Tax=Spartinivicinus marinus TaxID=2994442 RepID=A0A853I6R2_9GAMM|nr:NPP1 family protein [Spartinivicinus marinus]MCX4026235.1 NPP1 family protein [Spartinivicinus marinus]NYZ67352.1 NPP1 family protein [Spartinivicinus marinus]
MAIINNIIENKTMSSYSKSTVKCLMLGISLVSFSSTYAHEFPSLDKAYQSIPDASQVSLVEQYYPVFDFTGNSCLPAAAISRTGKKNGGLGTSGTITGDCRKHKFLTASNTYHRWTSQTINGVSYSAHLYDLYFEKDQVANYVGGGHRHDVETVIIYFTNLQPTHVAVSAHGDYSLRAWSGVPKEGNHPKVVYYKDPDPYVGIIPLTHSFRFAHSGESVSNPYYNGAWVTPTIVSWYEMKGDGVTNSTMRDLFNGYSYGKASFKFKDSNFTKTINKTIPAGYPVFTD